MFLRLMVICLFLSLKLLGLSLLCHISNKSGFGGLEVACWPLVPKFAGLNPAETLGIFRAKKSSARFPSEKKYFAACKRSLELGGSRIVGEICCNISIFRCWRSLASLEVKAPSGEGGNV
jgi:hypothetical protein